jgi:hypothetical protein
MAEYRKVYGLGAEFDSAVLLLTAAKIRDAGFEVMHTLTQPRMDKVMARQSAQRAGVHGGAVGLLTAVLLTWFRRSPSPGHERQPHDWRTPRRVFLIMFELTVLFSAFTIVSRLIMNRLSPVSPGLQLGAFHASVTTASSS